MGQHFQHKKSLGQHFLNSPVVPGWLCDAGEVKAGDTVLELGPGTGALTAELLARGARVCAIEADQRAVETLQERFSTELAAGTLLLEQGDLRSLTAETIAETFALRDHEYKLIANIPYYLSGLLFRIFLETTVQPRTLVFLVQKEIATRIARDKKESILSLSVKAFGSASYIRTVSSGHFTPPPQVDSAILAITGISRHNFVAVDMDLFFNLLHLGFGQKRKQLLGNLAANYERNQLEQIFLKLDLSVAVRAEDVSLTSWLALTHALSTLSTT